MDLSVDIRFDEVNSITVSVYLSQFGGNKKFDYNIDIFMGYLRIEDIGNDVCTEMVNCLCNHKRVILVLCSPVAKQRGEYTPK